jgi:hypothetical protein
VPLGLWYYHWVSLRGEERERRREGEMRKWKEEKSPMESGGGDLRGQGQPQGAPRSRVPLGLWYYHWVSLRRREGEERRREGEEMRKWKKGRALVAVEIFVVKVNPKAPLDRVPLGLWYYHWVSFSVHYINVRKRKAKERK